MCIFANKLFKIIVVAKVNTNGLTRVIRFLNIFGHTNPVFFPDIIVHDFFFDAVVIRGGFWNNFRTNNFFHIFISRFLIDMWVQGSSATPVSWSIQERRSCTWLSTDA